MPSRIIDFDALWNSDKLRKLPVENRVDYLWIYGIADANGSFELNPHAIVAKVSALRPELTLERIRKCVRNFERVGLLFTWEYQSKQYGHWVGSETPGRLPAKSQRHKHRKDAPPVPIDGPKGFNEYLSRFGIDPNLATALEESSGLSSTGFGVGVGSGLGVGVGSGFGKGKGKGLGFGVGAAAAETAAPQPRTQPLNLPLSEAIGKPGASWTCPDCTGTFPESLYLAHKCTVARSTRDRAAQLLVIAKSAREKPGAKS